MIQRDSLSAGSAGVSLSYAISITALLNWVVRQTVEAENSMNSVERSKFYTDQIAQEAPSKVPEVDDKLANNWPSAGAIEFKDLQIRYRAGLPLVLHGISLNIKGGERVGIVGRTGAGSCTSMKTRSHTPGSCSSRSPSDFFFVVLCLSCSLVAGKSSLMVALFRIVEAAAGKIIIDGQDISKLGLDALRSKLASPCPSRTALHPERNRAARRS